MSGILEDAARFVSRAELTAAAERLAHANHADGSGMMAGTAGAARSSDEAKAAFKDLLRKAVHTDIANALLEAEQATRTEERLQRLKLLASEFLDAEEVAHLLAGSSTRQARQAREDLEEKRQALRKVLG